MPVVDDAVYHASIGEVRLYLNDNIADYISLNPYKITSKGLKDTAGNTVLISSEAYFTPEEETELYDICIANVWFKQNDLICYVQPNAGPCDVFVRVLNSSYEPKIATLKISAIGTDGKARLLKEEEVTLQRETEITKGYEELTFFEGEKLDIKLVK
ncbi:MAG: hypothetical protein IKL09_08230 [Clostridia bacterium]|nr:hypothetical protein [Clostridia bacterium]MBR6647487.1 hypothetical protein [Clostridia bacterium]